MLHVWFRGNALRHLADKIYTNRHMFDIWMESVINWGLRAVGGCFATFRHTSILTERHLRLLLATSWWGDGITFALISSEYFAIPLLAYRWQGAGCHQGTNEASHPHWVPSRPETFDAKVWQQQHRAHWWKWFTFRHQDTCSHPNNASQKTHRYVTTKRCRLYKNIVNCNTFYINYGSHSYAWVVVL